MNNIKLYVLILLSTFLLSGCSWIEYFTVVNLSEKPIYINYKLNPLSEGNIFGIFNDKPTFYKVGKKGTINLSNSVEIKGIDKEDNINLVLPAKTAMIFGKLNNDNYNNPSQDFINGREFNLQYIEVEVNLEIHHVSKKAFNHYFKKKNGVIKFEVN